MYPDCDVCGKGFQPSSDLQAGCNGGPPMTLATKEPVSTLIRPSGRMQRKQHPTLPTRNSMFQPSSDLQAGCNLVFHWNELDIEGFNPHPTFRPDATPVLGFPIGSSRTSSTTPLDGHFRYELFKSLTRAPTRTRTSSVRGRQQWVRVTPRGGRRSRPRCPVHIPRLVGPGFRAACKTGCCPASRR